MECVYPLPSIGRTPKSGYSSQPYLYPYLSALYTSLTLKNATESPQIPANGKLYRIKKSEKHLVNQTFCSTFALVKTKLTHVLISFSRLLE